MKEEPKYLKKEATELSSFDTVLTLRERALQYIFQYRNSNADMEFIFEDAQKIVDFVRK